MACKLVNLVTSPLQVVTFATIYRTESSSQGHLTSWVSGVQIDASQNGISKPKNMSSKPFKSDLGTTIVHSSIHSASLMILTPLIETPDPPFMTPRLRPQKRWQLDTPADIPRILRVSQISPKKHNLEVTFLIPHLDRSPKLCDLSGPSSINPPNSTPPKKIPRCIFMGI